MRYAHPELRDRLASEYVLGTLHGRARRRFEKLMAKDRSLAALVVTWQDRFMPLASGLDPVEPSADVLAAIEKRIGIAPAQAPPRPVSAVQAKAESWFSRWFGGVGLGMMVAGLALGVAVSQLVPIVKTMLGGPQVQTAQLPESYVGILADAQGVARMLVSSRRHGNIVDVKVLAPVPVMAGKKLYLWAVPAGGAAPFRIGEVPATGKGTIRMGGTSEELLRQVPQLAVSAEADGPPPDKPSDFILRGHCAKLW